jgi:hypothetical protein
VSISTKNGAFSRAVDHAIAVARDTLVRTARTRAAELLACEAEALDTGLCIPT